eukprot:CAMPEP_0185031304 /NCGR_PEP_ID=MMETSP1103-20130426/18702_1 /TAXON_ID=36769 /ORGANISM="Paraphysomonas bandaiensis, Strain Caron Lab Isolate" /LENGTH=119 /DNA_ID=CAMNT_0027566789 /DNA_START=532 /DNA_END=891 /DNA_ORIENTATION=-
MGYEEEVRSFCSLQWYVKAMGVLHLNAIRTVKPAGSALYSDISFMNHSCKPSVGVIFDAMEATVVALHDLDAGDELLLNYIESDSESASWSHKEEQDYLKYNYGFSCKDSCSCGKYVLT